MEKVMLIVSNDKIRQVYHEILMSKKIEIVPVSTLSTAIVLISFEQFTTVILDVDENNLETEILLNLRKKYDRFKKIKFILLTENKNFNSLLSKSDLGLSRIELSTGEIISKIKKFLN